MNTLKLEMGKNYFQQQNQHCDKLTTYLVCVSVLIVRLSMMTPVPGNTKNLSLILSVAEGLSI